MEQLNKVSIDDYWFKVVGMLQQNWAIIEGLNDAYCTVYFVDDASGIFDQISFTSPLEAEAALIRNGFKRFSEDKQARTVISEPRPPFDERQHPNGRIYSSGKYWI